MNTARPTALPLGRFVPRCRQNAQARHLAERTVVVLYGGESSEREISLISGRGMLTALQTSTAGELVLPRVLGVEIDSTNHWLLWNQPMQASTALTLLPSDAIFLLGLHGGAGEDGRIQAFLENAGRIYTGSGPRASMLCMDKHLTRLLLSDAGLNVAPGRCYSRALALPASISGLDQLPRSQRWFVKPVHGGSSVLTTRAESLEEVRLALQAIHASGDDALVEECILGLEVTVAVVGNRASGLSALPLLEILPRRSPFFDYREKYAGDGAIELCPAQHLQPDEEQRVAEHALRAYQAAGCDGYARIDFIVPTLADGKFASEPIVLEINTLPGFTPTSLVPKEAAAVGVSYRELLLEICALALERLGGTAC